MLTRKQEEQIVAAVHCARNGIIPFTRMCDPSYIPGRVHRFIAKWLEAVERGECRRLVLNMPPRHGKTRLASVELPAYALGRNPKKEIVTAAYSGQLSGDSSKLTRALLVNPAYKTIFPDTVLADRAIMNWSTTKRGKYRAVGVGGTLTGRGSDISIVDDPHKDYTEAHSQVMRDNVYQWFKSTLYTRQSSEGAIILIHTRWHEDDLTGRLLKEEPDKWKVIKLPGLAKENDPLGRAPGEALFPERFNERQLLDFKDSLGSYLWASLYDQEPIPEGGNQIKIGNISTIDREKLPPGLQWHRFWDLAESEDKIADDTCGVKGAIDAAGNLYLADMVSGQWAWGTARETIKSVAEAEGMFVRIGIETTGGFGTAYENLKEVLPPDVGIREYKPETSKMIRALPWIALTERKKVFLVRGDWIVDFLSQAAAFPNGKHDDKIDAVSGVYLMCKESVGQSEAVPGINDEYEDHAFGIASRREIF